MRSRCVRRGESRQHLQLQRGSELTPAVAVGTSTSSLGTSGTGTGTGTGTDADADAGGGAAIGIQVSAFDLPKVEALMWLQGAQLNVSFS